MADTRNNRSEREVVPSGKAHGYRYFGHVAKLVPIHKWFFCPISVLRSKFYPRNINYMHPKGTSWWVPAVKFFARLDLDQNSSFLDGH